MDLSVYGITARKVLRNASPARLYQDALRYEEGTTLSSTGALIAYSGEKTGRSPNDKRLVKHPDSQDHVWWGEINKSLTIQGFAQKRAQALSFFNQTERLYVVDAFVGWDPAYRLKVRVITSRPYHALFMHNMLIRATSEELSNFGEPDIVIYNAGQQKATKEQEDLQTLATESETSVCLSIETGELVILGTEYAGEMKKGVFTLMNYLMPKKNAFPMHCSATVEKEGDSSVLLFGLSGTGKTTLSADPVRELVGDDEHVWTDAGVFNMEGGCYAKAIDLSEEKEPDIFKALTFGAVLENVLYDEDHVVDYSNTKITQNTRGCYPIETIPNARIPCVAGHPKNVIFLTCDAFGVLPPVSKLTPAQAMYHFISGYTAKVAGTEMGVSEPQATFSACFGAPFMVWHPAKYAALLAQNLQKHNVSVWLVNTGWSGGGYGQGKRIKLAYSRAIVDAINKGELKEAPTVKDSIFGFEIVTQCSQVPDMILIPEQTWEDKKAYTAQTRFLANLFVENFKLFSSDVDPEVLEAGPKV